MSLEVELRVRRERLAELARREREQPASPDGRGRFWRSVERLLGETKEQREDTAAMALYDELDAMRTQSLEQERDQISEWLDRP